MNWTPLISKESVKADTISGLTIAVVVLPQGVAYAMIAGLPPVYGLYSAIVITIVAALFGSSNHLISGPTAALSIVVFSAVSPLAEAGTAEFIALVFVLTLIVGLIQFAMGLARLGSLVNFVSHSVIVGFTAGAAILIATSQLKHIFGMAIPQGNSFFMVWDFVFTNLNLINWPVFGISASTIFIAVILKRFLPKSPYLLIAMIAGSLLAYFLLYDNNIPLLDQLPAKLPSFTVHEFSYSNILKVSPNALAIAILGLTEALAISRAVAIKSHQRLNGNQEFIGQGLSNIVGSMFMSYAGSGSFTRSSINYQSGAKTPLSAIISAITLAIILLFVAPLTAYLPISALGGVILIVAYNLIDFKNIKQIAQSSFREFSILLITFIATLFLQLEYAIYIGVILSLLYYLKRISKPSVVHVAPDKSLDIPHFEAISKKGLAECPQLKIIRIYGSLFFAAIEHVGDEIESLCEEGNDRILIICNGINIIDISGAEFLVAKANKLKEDKGALYLCGLNDDTREFLDSGNYLQHFDEHNVFSNKEEAIRKIYSRLDKEICAGCEFKIFKECNS